MYISIYTNPQGDRCFKSQVFLSYTLQWNLSFTTHDIYYPLSYVTTFLGTIYCISGPSFKTILSYVTRDHLLRSKMHIICHKACLRYIKRLFFQDKITLLKNLKVIIKFTTMKSVNKSSEG